MTDVSSTALLELSVDLSKALHTPDRFLRLIDALRKIIVCDAVVILEYQGETLKPLAQQGLSQDVLGRRFIWREHPRFIEILKVHTPTLFPSDSSLPDPYDGLIMTHEGDLPVHACLGFPLFHRDQLIGVLTLDSLTPGAFDQIGVKTLEVIATIASATLQSGIMMALLENRSYLHQQVMSELNQESLKREGAELIGESDVMLRLKRDIELVAFSQYAVLVQGETGVGKELVARTLHQSSPRAHHPLVHVNCAALPEHLIESELFGHVKGAFTGAERDRTGKFRLADGGTLLLDEIGELPLAAQAKLLRVLQNQEIQPVGQDASEQVDVRIIAATNRDLTAEVDAGRFRSDLYHRLSVYPITVPPLRLREGDVPLLVGFFAEQLRRKIGVEQIAISPEVIQILEHYTWPGNVRELEHVISCAALRARPRCADQRIYIEFGDLEHLERRQNASKSNASPSCVHSITAHDPIPELEALPAQGSLKRMTEVFQRQCIYRVLNEERGNWAAAARRLEMDRANLTRMAKRLGIHVARTVHKSEIL
ncbi:nitric oxide reductase transcriptional regulator NorR [Neptunomonas phycophila]|uniref:nitric oxide reductase transcriptional regulator NorR n=1 Tax=Neptunomonas phycophila TaxID=1572645 RepID=UPI0023F7D755|nr:nitric oxide reductase transcriptional regulator NorR [Neptunomonas phycophila]